MDHNSLQDQYFLYQQDKVYKDHQLLRFHLVYNFYKSHLHLNFDPLDMLHILMDYLYLRGQLDMLYMN